MKAKSGASILLIILLVMYQDHTRAQSNGQNEKKQEVTKLHVHVSGSKADSLIGGADIYLESEEVNKSFTKNTITNGKGVGTLSNVPQGKVLIQITAEGWKTYGNHYTLDSSKKDINIILQPADKP